MKTEKKRQFKGSVLFTVVCVMSILIIFLTGTLVLAASANRRSHKSYSSSQTEYTARAAIESFTAAMSKNPDIVGAIQNITPSSPIYPEIVLSDSSLGQIGYYDTSGNFVENRIAVECLPDTENQFYYTSDGWVELNVVKITATAELGGEESTVVAYIRKKAPKEITQNTIKGLQTAGVSGFTTTASHFTGALAIGITETPMSRPYSEDVSTYPYSIPNGSSFDTDLAFINGSMKIDANSEINVNYPSFEMVVMGNLHLSNSRFINIKHTMPGNYVQKEVPYIYVDGKITCSSSLMISGNKYPFNVFAGSIDTWDQDVDFDADLYLMDTGLSRFGGSAGTSTLSAWTKSVVQRGETQFNSEGGSIYSMGSLELKQVSVRGDVRAEGDVTIHSGVTIDGDLVVGGNLTVNGSLTLSPSSHVYVGGRVTGYGSGPSINPGYEEKNNIYHDGEYIANAGYERVENIQYPYYKFPVTEMMPDYTGMKGLFGENLGWVGGSNAFYYFAQGAYDPTEDYSTYTADQMQTVIDESLDCQLNLPDGSVFYREVDGFGNETNNVTDDKYWFYDMFDASKTPITDMSICATYVEPYYTEVNYDGTDSGVATTEAISYFESATGVRVPVTTAVTFGGVYPISAFTGDIYPSTMTRDAITGAGGVNTNKIVKTLEEVQDDIGYDSSGSSFDPNIYYTDVPSDIEREKFKEWNEPSVRRDTVSGYEIKGNASMSVCIINSTIDKDLTLIPEGQMWVVLDGSSGSLSLGNDKKIIVDDTNGSVNFLVKGNFQLGNRNIISTKAMLNKMSVSPRVIEESDSMGITFYGEPGSSITYSDNCTICGTAKAPYTEIVNVTTSGSNTFGNITYIDGMGNSKYYSNGAHWVGSALVKGVSGANNFTILYTKAGGLGGGSIDTAAGTYIFNYFDQY